MECKDVTNFSKIHQIIQEYETLIKELTSEVDIYRSESEANKATISTLVKENQELATRLKEALSVTERDEPQHIYNENDLIDNLKKQLASLAKEKESVVQLWQTALKTVDYLEEELRLYEGRTHGYVPKIEIKNLKASYQKEIEKLHSKIEECNVKIEETRKTSTQELNEKEKLLEKEKKKYEEAEKTIKELELELKQLQEKLFDSEESRKILQTNLLDKNKQIDEFLIREEIAKGKVREAVNVIEGAFMEKDAALLREAQIKEELNRIIKIHAEVLQKNEMKTKTEINEIKTSCAGKLKRLEEQLNKTKEEIQIKNYEIEKYAFKLEALQRQIEFLQAGSSQNKDNDMNKLLVLEKNLESTFQKLLLSERKNLQLAAERDSIKSDIEQMSSHFDRDLKLKETEKRSLEIRITKLQEELKRSNSDLVETIKKLEEEKMKGKELRKRYQTDKGSCKRMVSDINIKSSKVYKSLKKCYDKQVDISKKWKAEAIRVYKTLSTQIKVINDDCKKLKIQNFELKDKLLELESIIRKYQQFLNAFCQDIENLNT